ncbi:MAG: YdjY domain-containing protein [Phycisphaeraceae bacterium]|nr:YdjY domain-containing protein [Phycisphaeraceae bacterium]
MLKMQTKLSTVLAAALILAAAMAWAGSEAPESEAPTTRPAQAGANEGVPQPVELPGVKIDFENRTVDVTSVVCLDQGALELIATTEGNREHESIVMVKARPMHIHTGLLLLGSRNGHPALRRPINEEKTRWISLPPRGDPVDVSLVVPGLENDEPIEVPIGEFMRPTEDEFDQFADPAAEQQHPDDMVFPSTFLFAGSQLFENEEGERRYLADINGNVISITTFGDEVLCAPGIQSRDNGQLLWEIDPGFLPKVGTEVILRLRPKLVEQEEGQAEDEQPEPAVEDPAEVPAADGEDDAA